MKYESYEDVIMAWRRGEPLTAEDVAAAVRNYADGAYEGGVMGGMTERTAERYAEDCQEAAIQAIREAGAPPDLLPT